jgi:hypothetical protein
VWQARLYRGLDPVAGARRYTARTIHAKAETAAQRELRKLERQVAAGRAPRGTTAVTLGEQRDDWYAKKKPRLAPGTRLGYESAINLCEPPTPLLEGFARRAGVREHRRTPDAWLAAIGRMSMWRRPEVVPRNPGVIA